MKYCAVATSSLLNGITQYDPLHSNRSLFTSVRVQSPENHFSSLVRLHGRISTEGKPGWEVSVKAQQLHHFTLHRQMFTNYMLACELWRGDVQCAVFGVSPGRIWARRLLEQARFACFMMLNATHTFTVSLNLKAQSFRYPPSAQTHVLQQIIVQIHTALF